MLKPGGRAVISDIVSTRPVPPAMRQDSELWSGCISGALTEEGFLSAFLGAGFPAVSILKLDPVPWRVVEGIHFHSMTVEAHKPAVVNEGSPDAVAVVYKGPFREVQDDQGQRLVRGRRELLTGEAGRRYRSTPYRESVELIEPSPEPLRGTAAEMLRDGLGTTGAGACCAPGKCC